MTNRDAMVITPRLKRRAETSPRERAQEERNTERATKRQRARSRNIGRRAQVGRAIARRKRPLPAGTARSGVAIRNAGRVLGAAALLAEGLILVGHGIRRAEHGASGRLIDAQDAHTMYGDLDEELTAVHNVRGFFSSSPQILRSIGNQGSMSAHLKKVAEDLRVIEKRRAVGADMIERDPNFDSADGVLDKVVEAADVMGLKSAAHAFLEFMRYGMWFKGWFK